MGLRVEARKDTRESTFNILRKYFHRLTKVYSAADESTFENLLPLPPEKIYLLRRRSTTYLPDEVYSVADESAFENPLPLPLESVEQLVK